MRVFNTKVEKDAHTRTGSSWSRVDGQLLESSLGTYSRGVHKSSESSFGGPYSRGMHTSERSLGPYSRGVHKSFERM